MVRTFRLKATTHQNMNTLTSLCPASWNHSITFLSKDEIKQRHGAVWYRLAALTSSMHKSYEMEILMARALKIGTWPLRRTEEILLEKAGLPNCFWIKYRMLGHKQYRERGLPPPANLPRNTYSFEWAPWLEQKRLDLILEMMDEAADERETPLLRGTFSGGLTPGYQPRQ